MRLLGEEAKGKWVKGEDTGWGEDNDEVLLEGENPFEKGGYMLAPVSNKEISELRYTPHPLPAGEYAVYVSYKSLPNSTTAAKYTVVHRGQKTEFEVNQQMGGGTWVYLGTFAFDADINNNYVTLSNAGKGNAVVTADAVKFGGGIGNVARYPQPDKLENMASSQDITLREAEVDSAQLLENQTWAETSGMPRYLEAARYWMQYAGIPDSIYNYTASKNDYVDDYAARGIWVNYLAGGSAANPNEPGLGIPLHASLAFHTDAGVKDEVVGTLIIYKDYDDEKNKNFPTGKSRIVARDLADYMQTQIVEDMHQLYAPEWTRRQLDNSSYAEARHPKVPAVLLELLSHQNMTDMKYGLDPRVRFAVSRAIYKSILRFMHEQYGTEYVVQPLPVQQMSMRLEQGTKNQEQGLIEKYNAVQGFLNLSIAQSYWVEQLQAIARNAEYGQLSRGEGEKPLMMVEYSSPNTNKPLHLGHVRNNLLGYSIAKIQEANGWNVVKTNIVNDRGIHICKSMLAWQKFGNGETPENSGKKGDHLIGDYYVRFDVEYKAQIKELMAQGMDEETAKKEAPLIKEAQAMLVKWEQNDPEVRALWQKMNEWVYAGFDETYKQMGVGFDKIYYESDTYLVGKCEVERGLAKGDFYRREDGSVWADLAQNGLDEKLLLRADGTSVYMTQDIGTAKLRFEDYPIDKMVYVAGHEQVYHFKVLSILIILNGYPHIQRMIAT